MQIQQQEQPVYRCSKKNNLCTDTTKRTVCVQIQQKNSLRTDTTKRTACVQIQQQEQPVSKYNNKNNLCTNTTARTTCVQIQQKEHHMYSYNKKEQPVYRYNNKNNLCTDPATRTTCEQIGFCKKNSTQQLPTFRNEHRNEGKNERTLIIIFHGLRIGQPSLGDVLPFIS